MATTAMEACNRICLLSLVNGNRSTMEKCRPETCSAWVWDDGFDRHGNRFGHCAVAVGGRRGGRPPSGDPRTQGSGARIS